MRLLYRLLKRFCRFLRKFVLPSLTISQAFTPPQAQAGTAVTDTVTVMNADGTPDANDTVSLVGTGPDGTTQIKATGTTDASGVAAIGFTAQAPTGAWSFVATVQGEDSAPATFTRRAQPSLEIPLRPGRLSSLTNPRPGSLGPGHPPLLVLRR